jgi:hypothetical protein
MSPTRSEFAKWLARWRADNPQHAAALDARPEPTYEARETWKRAAFAAEDAAVTHFGATEDDVEELFFQEQMARDAELRFRRRHRTVEHDL